MFVFSPKKIKETAIPKGTFRLLQTAMVPVLTKEVALFQRKKQIPEAKSPKKVSRRACLVDKIEKLLHPPKRVVDIAVTQDAPRKRRA